MPRAFRSSPGGLVGHNGGVFAPNPKDSENAVLTARARRLNPCKVTPEILAGYYTFAGITERVVAAKLHQHYVTWDDVNDYSGQGVGAEDYPLMMDLSIHGLHPADLRRWCEALRGGTPVDPRSILKLFILGITPETALAYLKAGAPAADIPTLIADYGMSITQTARYFAATANSPGTPVAGVTRDLAAMTAKARNRELACQLVAFHIPPILATGWNVHCDALGVDQCSALIRAGFNAAEVSEHPELGTTARDLLEIQASLADLSPTTFGMGLVHA